MCWTLCLLDIDMFQHLTTKAIEDVYVLDLFPVARLPLVHLQPRRLSCETSTINVILDSHLALV